MSENLNLTCPGCGEHEVTLMVAGQGEGPLRKEGFYTCERCGWKGNERALRCGIEHSLTKEIRECFYEDRRRGEPGGGGGDAAGRAKDTKPREVRAEQDALSLWGDEAGRATQEFVRDTVFGAKFTGQESVGILGAIQHSGLTKSKWIQRALVLQARQEMQDYNTGCSVTSSA